MFVYWQGVQAGLYRNNKLLNPMWSFATVMNHYLGGKRVVGE